MQELNAEPPSTDSNREAPVLTMVDGHSCGGLAQVQSGNRHCRGDRSPRHERDVLFYALPLGEATGDRETEADADTAE